MNQLGQQDSIGLGRLILTVTLVMLVFFLWALFFTPPKKDLEQHPPQKIELNKQEQPLNKDEEVQQTIHFIEPKIFSEKEEFAELENEYVKIKFSNRGGVVTNVFLKKYKEKNSQTPDDLVSPLSSATNQYPLSVLTLDEKFDNVTKNALFHMEQKGNNVVFSWSDGEGNSLKKTFFFDDKGYTLNYKIEGSREKSSLKAFFLTFGPGLGNLTKEQAKNRYFQQEYVGYEINGKFKKASRAKIDFEPFTEEIIDFNGGIVWSGMANNYFTSIFLPSTELKSIRIRTIPLNDDLKKLHPADSDIILLVEAEGRGKIYLGPKDFKELKNLKNTTFRMMNWGWSWFAEICYFLLWILKKLYLYSHNYGLSILLLTLIVKLFFYPITQNSMVKMKEMGDAMKKIKPQIDKIRAKYKKQGLDMQSRAKMNEEMMALYQKEGVNPMGGMSGCLPLLLQMPIFWALFTILPNTIDLRGAHFVFWIKDLSLPDPLYITPIIMGITMIFSTMMTNTQQIEASQKILLYIMPLMFTWFCLWAPAGLTLYWLSNNILTIGQQYLINKKVEKRAFLAQKSKKSTPKKPSRPS